MTNTTTTRMSAARRGLQAILTAAISLGGLAGLADLAGCDDGDSAGMVPGDAATPDAGADAGPKTIIPNETVGGTIPPPDGAAPPVVLPTPYEPATGCCSVSLWIADPDGNETTAMVYGDLPPLKAGIPLAWKDGRWSATVCLPRDEQITYRFFFGKKPEPTLVDPADPDAGSPDDADAMDPADGSVDAGPDADDLDASAAPGAEVPLIDDYRANPDFPTGSNDDGTTQNVYPAVSVCNTTGM